MSMINSAAAIPSLPNSPPEQAVTSPIEPSGFNAPLGSSFQLQMPPSINQTPKATTRAEALASAADPGSPYGASPGRRGRYYGDVQQGMATGDSSLTVATPKAPFEMMNKFTSGSGLAGPTPARWHNFSSPNTVGKNVLRGITMEGFDNEYMFQQTSPFPVPPSVGRNNNGLGMSSLGMDSIPEHSIHSPTQSTIINGPMSSPSSGPIRNSKTNLKGLGSPSPLRKGQGAMKQSRFVTTPTPSNKSHSVPASPLQPRSRQISSNSNTSLGSAGIRLMTHTPLERSASLAIPSSGSGSTTPQLPHGPYPTGSRQVSNISLASSASTDPLVSPHLTPNAYGYQILGGGFVHPSSRDMAGSLSMYSQVSLGQIPEHQPTISPTQLLGSGSTTINGQQVFMSPEQIQEAFPHLTGNSTVHSVHSSPGGSNQNPYNNIQTHSRYPSHLSSTRDMTLSTIPENMQGQVDLITPQSIQPQSFTPALSIPNSVNMNNYSNSGQLPNHPQFPVNPNGFTYNNSGMNVEAWSNEQSTYNHQQGSAQIGQSPIMQNSQPNDMSGDGGESYWTAQQQQQQQQQHQHPGLGRAISSSYIDSRPPLRQPPHAGPSYILNPPQQTYLESLGYPPNPQGMLSRSFSTSYVPSSSQLSNAQTVQTTFSTTEGLNNLYHSLPINATATFPTQPHPPSSQMSLNTGHDPNNPGGNGNEEWMNRGDVVNYPSNSQQDYELSNLTGNKQEYSNYEDDHGHSALVSPVTPSKKKYPTVGNRLKPGPKPKNTPKKNHAAASSSQRNRSESPTRFKSDPYPSEPPPQYTLQAPGSAKGKAKGKGRVKSEERQQNYDDYVPPVPALPDMPSMSSMPSMGSSSMTSMPSMGSVSYNAAPGSSSTPNNMYMPNPIIPSQPMMGIPGVPIYALQQPTLRLNPPQRTATPEGVQVQGLPKGFIEKMYAAYSQEDPKSGQLVKKFRCLIEGCERIFPRKSAIHSHIQTHLDDKPFMCDQPDCRSSFVRQHDLRRHMRIHTGNKPFPCSCGKGFARGDALMRHRQRNICIGGINPPEEVIMEGQQQQQEADNRAENNRAVEYKQEYEEEEVGNVQPGNYPVQNNGTGAGNYLPF